MEHDLDARGNGTTEGIDARGNEVPGGNDAHGIDGQPALLCPVCEKVELRTTGPGRRPRYCSRSCSSKADRKRRADRQQAALTDALIASRVESPGNPEGGELELLELARTVERAAVRYLQRLGEARQGGEDPQAEQALEVFGASVGAATQRLVRTAHVLRHAMVVTRVQVERGGVEVSAGSGAEATGQSGAVSSRVETRSDRTLAVDSLVSPRVESGEPLMSADSPRVETRPDASPAVDPMVSSRLESPAGAGASQPASAPTVPVMPVQQRGQAFVRDEPVQELSVGSVPSLALGELMPRLSVPADRGLGAAERSHALGGGLVVHSWPDHPSLHTVERDGRLFGWIEQGIVDPPNAWVALIDRRPVVDADDSQPLLSTGPRDALTLLGLAQTQLAASTE
ncbi:hypothetical protein ACWEQL_21120 [Kitasatospora sp. NPDC004240]